MTTKETYRYRGDDIVPMWQSPQLVRYDAPKPPMIQPMARTTP